MRVFLAALCACFLLSISPSVAADLTGIWSILGSEKSKILIEQQTTRSRVALVGANEINLAHKWYIGETSSNFDTQTTMRVEALSSRRLFGRSDFTVTVVALVDINLTFADPFRGTLRIGARSFDIERKPLVADGLIAPIDPEAPETGWYEGSGVLGFVEGQGRSLILTTLASTSAGPSAAVEVVYAKNAPGRWSFGATTVSVAGGSITGFRRAVGGQAAETFARYQSGNVTRTFAEDISRSLPGVDADRNGIRDDIDIIIGNPALRSQRLRFALQELARAYQSYFAAPSQITAQAARRRADIAKACVDLLATRETGDSIDLVESLLFNTQPRLRALDQLPVLAGPELQSIPPVSLANPNLCAAFMSGVIRRFDQLSIGQIRAAISGRSGNKLETVERTEALARAKKTDMAANNRVRTCGSTQILLVTGVATNQETASRDQLPKLKSLLQANRLDPGDFDYAALADAEPGLFGDVAQYLVAQLNVTHRQASEMARNGFTYMFRGVVKVLLVRTPAGIVGGGITIGRGILNGVGSILARRAIDANTRDIAAVRAALRSNFDDAQRTIAVAHSRGNLRINEAYGSSDGSVMRTIGITSVANAARNVATGGAGATRDDDLIMSATRRLFGSEAATISGAGEPKSWDGHALVASYLGNLKAAREVLRRASAALTRAQYPAPGRERVLASLSGGFTGLVAQTNDYDIGRSGVTFRLEYQAYTIPDRFDVIYRGRRLASTGGLVSGRGTLNVTIPRDAAAPSDGRVIVAVYGPNPGTAWDYRIVCPSNSNPSVAWSAK